MTEGRSRRGVPSEHCYHAPLVTFPASTFSILGCVMRTIRVAGTLAALSAPGTGDHWAAIANIKYAVQK